MNPLELVLTNDGNHITGAEYVIGSAMLQNGQPAAVIGGGGTKSLLESLKLGDLAVPLGLFYLQDLARKSSDSFNTSVFELYDDNESSEVKLIEDSLYDKLLAMVNGEESRNDKKRAKMTRKKRESSSMAKKTRRN
jgi:hypothetical protein